MFFLGEYGSMLLMSSFGVLLFLGGWSTLILSNEIIFALKIVLFCFFFIFVRAQLPRYRYDQLMVLG